MHMMHFDPTVIVAVCGLLKAMFEFGSKFVDENKPNNERGRKTKR